MNPIRLYCRDDDKPFPELFDASTDWFTMTDVKNDDDKHILADLESGQHSGSILSFLKPLQDERK